MTTTMQMISSMPKKRLMMMMMNQKTDADDVETMTAEEEARPENFPEKLYGESAAEDPLALRIRKLLESSSKSV
jgi:hypothetical protein